MGANVWGRRGLAQKGAFRGIFLDGSYQGTLPLAVFTGPGGWGVGGRSLEGKGYKGCPWRWVLGERSSALPPPGLDSSV